MLLLAHAHLYLARESHSQYLQRKPEEGDDQYLIKCHGRCHDRRVYAWLQKIAINFLEVGCFISGIVLMAVGICRLVAWGEESIQETGKGKEPILNRQSTVKLMVPVNHMIIEIVWSLTLMWVLGGLALWGGVERDTDNRHWTAVPNELEECVNSDEDTIVSLSHCGGKIENGNLECLHNGIFPVPCQHKTRPERESSRIASYQFWYNSRNASCGVQSGT